MEDENPFNREFYGCYKCHDVRYILRGDLEVRCQACEGWTDEHRHEMRRFAIRDGKSKPTITRDDLTTAELADFKRLVRQHPDKSPVTILSWFEGSRYDPEKDPDFQRECLKELRKWRFETNRPEPETTLDIPTPTPML